MPISPFDMASPKAFTRNAHLRTWPWACQEDHFELSFFEIGAFVQKLSCKQTDRHGYHISPSWALPHTPPADFGLNSDGRSYSLLPSATACYICFSTCGEDFRHYGVVEFSCRLCRNCLQWPSHLSFVLCYFLKFSTCRNDFRHVGVVENLCR